MALMTLLDIGCLKNGTSGGITPTDCNTTEMGYIEGYRKSYMKLVEKLIDLPNVNIWTIACFLHCYAFMDEFYDVSTQKVPETTGMTVKDAVEKFVFDPSERVIQIDS